MTQTDVKTVTTAELVTHVSPEEIDAIIRTAMEGDALGYTVSLLVERLRLEIFPDISGHDWYEGYDAAHAAADFDDFSLAAAVDEKVRHRLADLIAKFDGDLRVFGDF